MTGKFQTSLLSRPKAQRLLSLMLLSGISLLPPCMAQGTLPSLETHPGGMPTSLTPLQDFSGQSLNPASNSSNASDAEAGLQTVSNPSTLPLKPAVHHQPTKSFLSLLQDETKPKPISYNPLPGIIIFPVVKHGNEKAFGDIPVLFAREYAQRLELKVPDTKIYHPVYTVEELRVQGLGHVYDQIMSYYRKAGRPEPLAMDYLLKQISNNNKPISRVIFVEADLDTARTTQATNPIDWAKQFMTDGTPQQTRYFIHSRMQVFNAENPDFPMVWGGSWTRSIKTNQFINLTPSVFDDSDSQQAFARLSREMSREILFMTPKTAYMDPQFDTAVQGHLVSDRSSARQPVSQRGFSALKPNQAGMSAENQEAIQRILKRQSSGNP